jgi:PKD repeat protein
VTLTITDDDGGIVVDALVVTVANLAPTVNAGPDQVVGPGETVFLATTFTDVGTSDTHTATVDWGDGNVETGVVSQVVDGTVTGSHSYTEAGEYTVTVTVLDDGGESSDTFTVTVEPQDYYVVLATDQEIKAAEKGTNAPSWRPLALRQWSAAEKRSASIVLALCLKFL